MTPLIVIIIILVFACIAAWILGNQKHIKGSERISTNLDGTGILEAISDGVVITDTNGTISMINPAAGLLAGWNIKDALGVDNTLVFKFQDDKGSTYSDEQNPFKQVLRDGLAHRDNNATLVTNGSQKTITVSITTSPILREGKLHGAIGILRDVSQERQAEQQRADFISTASHEMRTPVAAIEGYLALAMNEKVSTIDLKARDYLQKAHESAQHLGTLFQDLLTSAKAEDGRLISHPEVIEVSNFLAKLSQDLRFVAQKKNLAVEFIVGVSGARMDTTNETGSARVVRPLYNIYADPERMREVITNLFDNAVKYSNSGKISIGLTGDDSIVQIYIRDTGFGIAIEDIPHLFQKFYRVDNSDTRTVGGTGLGLYICRKIVELYNGRIWVESEQGKG
ncbi:PAS domain-containing protein, partial [Candidatus Saccharibacteria bacterium]|nr:PAS domain-containing protein [Candidatus Saccharibacteria bacterium]